MLKRYIKPISSQQSGFASIIIALVLISILALLTIGFAQLARREQQTALNKQLATQANYAAESGINDIVKALPRLMTLTPKPDKDTCLTENQIGLSPAVNGTSGVSYSCALVNIQPPNLVYSDVESSGSRRAIFSTNTGLSSLAVNWSSSDGQNSLRTIDQRFSPTPDWHSPAVIQFSLTKLGVLTREAIKANTKTFYLYPATGYNTTIDFAALDNQGKIYPACKNVTPTYCKVTIDNINAAPGEHMLVHMVVYYDSSHITLDEFKIGGIKTVPVGGQAQIDVTGRARTVLKRLQVRVPLSLVGGTAGNQVDLPDYAIEAGDICKRMVVFPNSTEYIDTNDSPAPADSACELSTTNTVYYPPQQPPPIYVPVLIDNGELKKQRTN